MAPVVATLALVWISEMSLERELELYEGWFTIRAVLKVVPPEVLEIAPITMMVFAVERPIVQCAADTTQRGENKVPPQKC
jgi:hypothetical protein